MSTATDKTAGSAEIPATPEAQAELMFELARNIAADPGCEIRPEGIALIACAAGIIGQAVARLEAAQARADEAYAEGARQRDEAAAHAAAITEDVPKFLQPVATEEPEPEDGSGYTSLSLEGRSWKFKRHTLPDPDFD